MLDSISSFLSLGGPVVALLVTLSVFALALIFVKLVQFWRERVGRHASAQAALHAWVHRDHARAKSLAEADPSPVGAALAVAMRLTDGRGVPQEVLEQEVGRVAQQRLHELQRGFRALEAIAQIAPLLGLFGTVLGMIEAFRQLQAAGNAVDPSLLAGGIWVALLTTAVGLAVAMPTQLFLTWFETRVENERVTIETLATAVITQGRIGTTGGVTMQLREPRAVPSNGEMHAH